MKKHLLFSLIFSLAFLSFEKPLTHKPLRKGKDYALFFAVEQYADSRLERLKNPISDAEKMATVLRDNYGFETEVVKNPSLDAIQRKLEVYRQNFASGKWKTDGQLLIYLTGHGSVEDDVTGYFLPADAQTDRLSSTAIAYSIWRRKIAKFKCQHILVVLDACYSGSFDPDYGTKNGDPLFGSRGNELTESQKLLSENERYQSRFFFTSASDDKTTPDQSTFAQKFLEGLQGRFSNDGTLTSDELWFNYLKQARPKPRGGTFEDNQADANFLFVAEKRVQNTEGVTALQKDVNMWQQAKSQNTISSYQEYIRLIPNGDFVNQAKKAIENLTQQKDIIAWEDAKKISTFEAYQKFITEFPNSLYVVVAQERLNSFFKQGNYATNLGHPPGLNCITAPMIYANDLPYKNILPLSNIPFPSQGCGSIENAHLFKFTPVTKDITFKITASNCTGGPLSTGSGLQIRVYQTTDCISFASIYCGSSDPIPANITEEVKITNLTSGGSYILMIDGQRNDVCNYIIGISEGSLPQNPKTLNRLPFEPEMVAVQGGKFQMGDVLNDNEYESEKPVHKVTLNSFQMGKYEVSQAEWVAIMGTNPSSFKGDNLPVSGVSGGDVQEYLKKLNAKTGKKY